MSLLLLCEVFVLVLGRRLGAGGGRRQGPFLVNTGYLESALGEGTHSQRRSCVIISGVGESPAPSKQNFNLQTRGGISQRLNSQVIMH